MTQLIDPELERKLIQYRHDFHAHPELADHEFRTTKKITAILAEYGIKPRPTNLKTGVFADIGNNNGPTIALRADIDALPVAEATGLAYSSQVPGQMHACGHDTHIAALLGAAYLLKRSENELPGKVRLIFQLAEEDHEGALQVINDGQLTGVDAIIGFHNAPFHPVGSIGIRAGISSGAIDKFKVTLTGHGTHASAPQNGVDPVVVLGAEINAIQSIVSRNVSPTSAGVISITHITAGTTWNVIPETVFFEGTVRTASKHTRALIKQRFLKLVQTTAEAYGATAAIDWYDGDPSVNNDSHLTAIVADECKRFATVYEKELELGSDDFACYQEHVPGVYVNLGNNGQVKNHNPGYIADDGVIAVGVHYFDTVARRLLNELHK